jgi:hypothetical protein
MGFWLIQKTVARNGPLSGGKRHYMGLNFGVFFRMGAYMGTDFQRRGSDGFTGVFFGPASRDALANMGSSPGLPGLC